MREYKFDKIIENYFGIIYGESTLVFIKTGRGGSIYGYNNKYLNLAHKIKQTYGFSVVVSANPLEYKCDLKLETDYVKKEINGSSNIIYIGVSNGAVIGALQACDIPEITEMILINGPLMINFHKLIAGLKQFKGSTYCIYGENDPSSKYTVLLSQYEIRNIDMQIVKDADHNFSGMDETLCNMIVERINSAT